MTGMRNSRLRTREAADVQRHGGRVATWGDSASSAGLAGSTTGRVYRVPDGARLHGALMATASVRTGKTQRLDGRDSLSRSHAGATGCERSMRALTRPPWA